MRHHITFDDVDYVSGTTSYNNLATPSSPMKVQGTRTVAEGFVGQGLSFAENKFDYGEITTGNPTGNYLTHSYALWVKWENAQSGSGVLFDYGNRFLPSGNISNGGSRIDIDSTGRVYAYHQLRYNETTTSANGFVDTGNRAATQGPILAPDVWTHITVVVTTSTNTIQKLYINGALYDSVTSTQTMRPPYNNIYVNGYHTDAYLNGSSSTLDELKTWTVALSDAEVLENYQGYATASQNSFTIGETSVNLFATTLHFKPEDSISAINVSSPWSG